MGWLQRQRPAWLLCRQLVLPHPGAALQLKDGAVEEGSIAYILHEVVGALEYLHGELRMHRDLKAANILLSAAGDVKMSGATPAAACLTARDV